MLHLDFPEPPCEAYQDDNDCKYTIVMHVFSITAVYNFIIILLYNITLYLVTKYNYDGLIDFNIDEDDEEEATPTRNTLPTQEDSV